jgi:hypothetical protein
MSSMPVRTRSIRKPAVGSSSQFDSSAPVAPVDGGGTRDQTDPRLNERRGNTSPSRLPKPPSTSSSLPRNSSVSQAGPGSNSSSNGSMHPPPRRATTSRPPLTSDNVRPTSYRSGALTPTESSSSSSIRRAPSTRHSRTASTSTLPSTSTSTSNQTRTTSVKPSSASTILHQPYSQLSTNAPQLRKPQPQLTSQIPPLNPPDATKQQQLQSRPAFSTLQQHFSPLKSLGPKPATASFLVPPSPGRLPSNIQLSAETARLQTELLQLHILHRNAPRVSAEYRSSAKRALRARFGDVAARQRELVAVETREEGRLNGLALKAWAEGARGWGLEGKAQRLDEVVTGVWSLGEAGGRHARLVRRFEKWLVRVQVIFDSRAGKEICVSGDSDFDSAFVKPLEDGWREECEHLARKLDLWREQLQDLDAPDAESGFGGGEDKGAGSSAGRSASSLVSTVRGMEILVKGMLAELNAMKRLERDIVRHEEEWIRSAVDTVSDDEAGQKGSVPGAIWRIY